ncbi:ubiquinol-cytochrome c reductase iron-sulfur subunit N-terminal domain-containing protein (plasmid) [Klebsiella michiganensis]|nr:ubiquinol-cytochrome c reductase iron-sulfur subunit N-terminal domain-containing protein [Klebsiella michiganensis]WKJ95799.1 ubiquinol-cytochrome c reductase iron-sulfur subunit N-terminal domain-containing protein [Klebsiella michiganensis]WKK01062.1 ubiquinol-cytochrome c reductase iron-sulfur subunit N-terminal domain-containing protein [Klebsiella michiganensis]WKK02855.1 ubiquinol-cytochrome c reductase iron-sulfur subunit N-terminal domain-containing protein [Klebsiella michiganensis]
MADKKIADGEIQEQRRECLCRLTKLVGATGVAAAVWPLVSALGPDEKALGENEPIDVSLAGIAA